MLSFHKALLVAGLSLTAAISATTAANASHGRGAAIVPSVSASGLLTLDMKSFWRQSAGTSVCNFPHDCITSSGGLSITGPGSVSTVSLGTAVQSLADSRYTKVTETNTYQLGGAGLYTIEWGSCCWISTVPKVADASYGTRSTIYWDGKNASAPIFFNLENVQIEVERGEVYKDNLDVVGGSDVNIAYGDTTSGRTSVGASRQATGYSIDSDGFINITAAGTSTYVDRPDGGDQAFDGKITATDKATGSEAGSVEFYWIFDGVADDPTRNQAPTVVDVVLNAIVGDTISQVVTATDPDGDAVTLSFVDFFGPGGQIFTAAFDAVTGLFTWDSTGVAAGTYIATINGTDGFLTDKGTITINLTDGGGPAPVPLPASALLLGAGLAGLAGLRRRAKRR